MSSKPFLFKRHFGGRFFAQFFWGNDKIINTGLKFLVKVPTQKVKYNLYKNQICITNLKYFSNQFSDSTSISSPFQSQLIRYLGTRNALKDTANIQGTREGEGGTRVLERLRHSS